MLRRSLIFITVMMAFLCTGSAQVLSDGVYIIRSAINRNYVLDLSNSNVRSGSNIQLWEYNGTNAQKWDVVHGEGEKVRNYVIISSVIDKNYVIDLNSSNAVRGENIQLWEWNGTKAQVWYVTKFPDGTYEIASSVNRNYVIDLSGSLVARGTNIQCWDRNNTKAQRWIFERCVNK